MRSLGTCLLCLSFFSVLVGCGGRPVANGSGYGGYAASGAPTTGENGSGGLDFIDDSSSADPGLSCLEIYNAVSECYSTYYNCASACQDQACADACEATYNTCYDAQLALGSLQGQGEFDGLRSCEENVYQGCYDEGGQVYNDCVANCSDDACAAACNDQATTVLQECMVDGCYNEYATCGVLEDDATEEGTGSDSSGSDSGSGGGNQQFTCGELYDCEDACDGNRSCGQICYDNGTELAQQQWTTLIQCGQMYCDGNVASSQEYRGCLQSMCASDYNTCFGSGGSSSGGNSGGGHSGSGGFGTETCGQGYSCVQGCYASAADENSFYNCVDGCYNDMSSNALLLMNDLVSCSNVQCSDVPGSMQNYYQCQQDFCTAEYNACVNDGGANSSSSGGQYGSNGQNGGASDLNTCADVHYAVLDVCVPGYSTCMANCSTQSCSDACGEEINTCIENQQNEVTFAEAQNFQAVRDCRSENFDSCNTEADDGYDTCVAGCGSTDTACQDNCADEANDAYEDCFADACSSEYATCGIGASTNATNGASQFTAAAHETCLEIWEANTDVCSPNYFQCLEGCSTDSCNEGCVEDYTGCMDAQKDAADATAREQYEAVETCRNDNYETCYGEGGDAYETCAASCSSTDQTCLNNCNEPANEAYNNCFKDRCSSEYATCGIE